MKSKTSFSIKSRLESIGYAWQGLHSFFEKEHNAIIHLFATIAVLIAGIFFQLSMHEFVALILAIGFVWVSEIFNTAIEAVMDHVTPEQHPKVKFIKDVAAAAVLVSAFTAVITGAIIFIPKIF